MDSDVDSQSPTDRLTAYGASTVSLMNVSALWTAAQAL